MTQKKSNKQTIIPPKQQGKTAFTRKFRAWYRTLPAGLQLVGLQLWMPLFFVTMLCMCYLFAFHAPRIADVPVAYVGAEAPATQLEEKLDGKIAISMYDSRDDATEAVRSGKMASAIESTDDGNMQLIIASAHQFQAATMVRQMLEPVLLTDGMPPTVHDLAPLPAHDAFGTVAMYMMLVTCIGGYMVGMFLGMMGGPLLHRTRIATLLVASFVLSLLAQVLTYGVDAVHGHFWQLWPLQWAWMFTIGLVVNGASYFVGRFIATVALTVFVFLSMPASGGAFPVYFLPDIFQWLSHVVVGSGITEMYKHILYGVGPGMMSGFTLLATYLLIGLVLTVIGKPLWERRRAKQILAGETTMFMDAQKANRDHNAKIRERIFADAGLVLPETLEVEGTVLETEGNGPQSGASDMLTTDSSFDRTRE